MIVAVQTGADLPRTLTGDLCQHLRRCELSAHDNLAIRLQAAISGLKGSIAFKLGKDALHSNLTEDSNQTGILHSMNMSDSSSSQVQR